MNEPQNTMAIMLQPTIRIPLTRGKFTTISELDAPRVLPKSWSANLRGKIWYAVGTIKENGKFKGCTLHRFLTGFLPIHIDHKNGDGLDNRRSNFRIATKSQNAANARKDKIKGVTFDKQWGRWRARIGVMRKSISLGCFGTAEEAAIAYNRAAAKHFGEFANPNKL